MIKSSIPLTLPYIRWAHTHAIGASVEPARTRRQLCDHLLIYFLSGTGNIWIDDRIYEVDPDTLFFLVPGLWYDFPPSTEGYTFASVHYDTSEMPDSSGFAPFRTAEDQSGTVRPVQLPYEWTALSEPYLRVKTRPRIRQLVEEIISSFGEWDDVSRFEASGLLAALIAQVSREVRTAISREQHDRVGPDAGRRVQQARRMLEDVGAPRDLAEVAASVGWSNDHLRHMCQSVIGVSPVRLRRGAIVRHAKSLLSETDVRIADVAEACGLDDQGYFARVFKKETGLTPRQFRDFLRV